MNKKTCCVCNRTGSDVAEYKSTLTDEEIPYCKDCLDSGREPYKDLVAFGYEFNKFNKTYQQKIVIPTLTFNKKTIQQFNEDVIRKRDTQNVTECTST